MKDSCGTMDMSIYHEDNNNSIYIKSNIQCIKDTSSVDYTLNGCTSKNNNAIIKLGKNIE